jgi:hypothetical protein
MRPMPEDPTPAPWRTLQEHLAGYFAARARGLLGSEFVLTSRSGEEFGRLQMRGPEGARFEAGDVEATIERAARSRYRMLTGDAETLVAEPAGPSGVPKVRCGNRLYDTRFDLLRNAAVARSPGGEVAARVAGGLTNLRYEAFLDEEDGGSLPVALFLLYRVVALRRRAFLAGGARGGEASRP